MSTEDPTGQRSDDVEAPLDDAAAPLQRITKMQRQLLQDMSSIRHPVEAMAREVPDRIDKLDTSVAMVARSVATGQVKADEAHAETRRLVSARLDALEARLSDAWAERAAERLLGTGLMDVLDSLEAVLTGASDAERRGRVYEALRMVNDQLTGALRPFGVERTPITPGATQFDDRLHDCVGKEPASGGDEGVVSAVHVHGYTLHGAPIRRAKVVVKGA